MSLRRGSLPLSCSVECGVRRASTADRSGAQPGSWQVTPEFAPWRIEHVDIGAALPEIGRTGDEAAVLVVLWLRGVPLGQLHLGAGELPLAPSALEALLPQTIAPAVADRLFGQPFQGRPPAHHSLPPQDLGAPDLAELLEPGDLMARLEETLAEPPPASWTLSVVICTRDR